MKRIVGIMVMVAMVGNLFCAEPKKDAVTKIKLTKTPSQENMEWPPTRLQAEDRQSCCGCLIIKTQTHPKIVNVLATQTKY